MKKLFMFCAAMLMALAVNAATVNINPGTATLQTAVAAAAAGDVIVLADGTYDEAGDYITLNKNIEIKAAEGAHPVVLVKTYVKIQGGSKIKIEGIKFDGAQQGTYSHFFRVYDNAANYLELEGCELCNNANMFIKVEADKHIDSIKINNCYFHDGTNNAIRCYKTSGSTNTCDKLVITNSTFANFAVPDYGCIQVENVGNAVTADIKVIVDHCTFYNLTKPSNNTYGVIDDRKSTDNTISNCIFANPAELNGRYAHRASQLYGGAVSNCLVFQTPNHRTDAITLTDPLLDVDPLMVDAANGDYTLGTGSPALTAATDGGAIGDPRWAPAPAPIEYRTVYCSIAAAAGWWKYDAQGQPNYIVAAYAWGGAPAENAAWPGALMEAVEGETDIFKIELDTRYQNIIFTRTSTAGVYQGIKTADLTLPADSNAMYAVTKATYDWSAYQEQLAAGDGMWTTYAPHVQVLEDGYYLMGFINGDTLATWTVADLNASRLFEANPATQGEYMLTTTLAAGDQLQVVQVVSDAITNWFPGGEGNNYVVDANHNGSKTIYFRPDRQGGQDWHMGCMYIAANETNINNVGGEAKAVKLIQNGKVIIRVNGENYTVLGQKVEK